MSKSWEEIFNIVQARRNADSAIVRRMRVIADHYHGDVVIPVPDVLGEPDLPPLMPQLIHDSVETNAMKANGPIPDLDVPAVDMYDEKSVARSRQRRRAFRSRWYGSQLELLMGRAYRQGVAYGTWHFQVKPNYDSEKPGAQICLRNPLSAYPDLRDYDEIRQPINVGYVYGRSLDWLHRAYPHTDQWVRDLGPQYEDQLWDMCEWIDEDDIVLGILGPRPAMSAPIEAFSGLELNRHPNKAGMVPCVAPRRLTLERISGQLDQMVGMVDWMGRLMALDVIAAERATFPDMVAFSEEFRPAELSGGQWKDGRTGDINVVSGAKDVRVVRTDPGQMTGMMIDRLERTARFSGGVPAVSGGEFTGSLRSGRVVDTMAAFSIDPRIAELQNIMSRALTCVNESVAEVEKGYFGRRKLVSFSGWPGDTGHVEYVPDEVFTESTESVVTYPMPGADISAISVAAAQMSGAGLSSKATGRRLHPFIADPIAEEVAIETERLGEAMLVSLQAGAQNGTVPFVDLAEIIRRREKGESLVDAVVHTHEAAQQRQATPAPPEQGMPVPPGSQPGLNLPGAGAEQPMQEPTPPIQQPPAGLSRLSELMNTLRAPSA